MLNQVYLGTVPGYKGPVSAFAIDQNGALYVKPDSGETFYVLSADGGCASSGRLLAGPFDAGELSDWSRVHAQIESPSNTGAKLQLFISDDPAAIPAEPDWIDAQAMDTLVPVLPPDPGGLPRLNRYLWLRISLVSDDSRTSPAILQVSAETASYSYLKNLPAIYQREDDGENFLKRWLALFKAEMTDAGHSLDDMPKRFETSLAPPEFLKWLSSWLAFDLPSGQPVDEQRTLLARVWELYNSRATVCGIREFSEIYSGVRPHIVEAFRERHIWQLGTTSSLGCDTGLAPISPNGLIVSDSKAFEVEDHQSPCDRRQQQVVGSIVVGASGPLEEEKAGETLYSDTAYRFTVLAPAALAPEFTDREALRQIIDSEKPAHTDYHLCFIEAQMRVGFQARLGIDTIVAGPHDPMALSGAVLGVDSYLGNEEGGDHISRVGKDAHVGLDTVLG
jgi:phage tail-like protein